MTKNIQKKKSPGGRILIHKNKKKKPKSHCKICGTILSTNLRNKTRSGKNIARPYGGEICHACLKTSINVLSF
ncbi:MAG: hypothetical protein ACFFAJ_03635 [Candidatus Hodarchaeota archaeon]